MIGCIFFLLKSLKSMIGCIFFLLKSLKSGINLPTFLPINLESTIIRKFRTDFIKFRSVKYKNGSTKQTFSATKATEAVKT